MQAIQDQELYDYFLREMDYLRSRAKIFAEEYDEVARELRLSDMKSSDPHVELLLQSFAYLSASVRRDMAAQSNHLPNQLLGILYPHLVKPVPTMFVIQPDVSPQFAKFDGLKRLDKGREFYADVLSSKKGKLRCTVSTAYETPLRPFDITEIRLSSIKDVSARLGDHLTSVIQAKLDKAHTALQVSIKNHGDKSTAEFEPDNLRFFVRGEQNRPHSAYQLYEQLAKECIGIVINNRAAEPSQSMDAGSYQCLDNDAIKWIGFNDDCAVLPFGDNSHSAYRIIQEYFLFPEKYLFFDVQGINGQALGAEFELYFLLSTPPDTQLRPDKNSLCLNSIPVINLYKKHLNSINLDDRDHEYRLVGDNKNHACCEIHSLTEVLTIPVVGEPERAQPYAGIDAHLLHANDRLYSTRTELSGLKSIPGTETYITLHKTDNQKSASIDDILAVKALCTNRRLAENLRINDTMTLVGPGPISRAKVISKPTMHKPPSLNSDKPWRLLSNLVLNTTTLETQGLDVLKSILLTYSDEQAKAHFAQVDSIVSIQTERVVRRVGLEGWRGLCRGLAVQIEIDITRFDGSSLHLFGEVLNRFMGLYANINSFVECSLTVKQEKGIFKQWPPLAGAQILL